MKKLISLVLIFISLLHIPLLEAKSSFFKPISPNSGHMESLHMNMTISKVAADSSALSRLFQAPSLQTGKQFSTAIRIKEGISFGEIDFQSANELVFAFGPTEGSRLNFRYVSHEGINRFTDIMSLVGDSSRNTGKVLIGSTYLDRARVNIWSDGVTHVAGSQTQGISLFVRRRENSENAAATFGIYTDIFGGTDARAIFAKSQDAPLCIGVRATAENASNVGYGLRGSARNCSTIAVGISGEVYDSPIQYAVYGIAATGGSSYAGYFNGDVGYTGSLTFVSDRQLKKNVRSLESSLGKVLQLRPSSYEFKDKAHRGMNLDEGLSYGFIAQELEEVLPELVSRLDHPMEDGDKEGEFKLATYKGVKYMQLIPILTGAIQEQQQMIKDQDARISQLEARVKELSAGNPGNPIGSGKGFPTEALLFQNDPNPFNESTWIRYELPANHGSAKIFIFDMQGRQAMSFSDLPASGRLEVKASSLEAGMYLYSLVVDGKEIATKRMILSH
ncbi:MAG: tail fiber domain-containing protein [Bacteroidia bacterium]|nr:tail fiber domain-containing protein [Bacteroidia bacterium]